MKNIIGSLLCMIAYTAFSASPAEFVKGVDFTGQPVVTGSLLNQLVDAAKPAANRGLIFVSNSAPDTVTFPFYTNYIWKDISTEYPTLKFYKDGSWVSAIIGDNSVQTSSIQNRAVTSQKLALGAVQTDNFGTNVIPSYAFTDLSIGTERLQHLSVTSEKLANNSIDNTKLKSGAVLTTNLADGTITSDKIVSGSVTEAKIADNSISQAKLKINSVHQTNIMANSIHQTNLMANSVVGSNIVNGTITRDKIGFSFIEPKAYIIFRTLNANDAQGLEIVSKHGVANIEGQALGSYKVTFSNDVFTVANKILAVGSNKALSGSQCIYGQIFPYSVSTTEFYFYYYQTYTIGSGGTGLKFFFEETYPNRNLHHIFFYEF